MVKGSILEYCLKTDETVDELMPLKNVQDFFRNENMQLIIDAYYISNFIQNTKTSRAKSASFKANDLAQV